MQQLQLLLTDYLDIQNIAGDPQQAPASFSEPTSDISVYFARRRPPRQKRTPLFKFDYSSHALSINSYLKEQRGPIAKVHVFLTDLESNNLILAFQLNMEKLQWDMLTKFNFSNDSH
jgi:hypothetical protein